MIKLYMLYRRYAVLMVPFALLVIRLAWGWELVESGWGHLHNIDVMTQRFTLWGIPHPRANVIISGCTELCGGALWMAGLGTRLISLPLVFNFCVAYLTASRQVVTHFFAQDPANFIDDSAFPFLVTSLLLIGTGAGKFSLDAVIRWVTEKHLASEGIEPPKS